MNGLIRRVFVMHETRGGFAPWATWAMARGVAQFFCLHLGFFSTKNWPTSLGTMHDVLAG
jgi:hypothetical protein